MVVSRRGPPRFEWKTRALGFEALTRNVLDFDFLQQLNPSGKVLFYR